MRRGAERGSNVKFGWSNFYRRNFRGNFPLLEIVGRVVSLCTRVFRSRRFELLKLIKLDRLNSIHKLETKNIRFDVEFIFVAVFDSYRGIWIGLDGYKG